MYLQHAINSKTKNIAVRQTETKLDQKDRPAGAIVLRRRCADHSKEWKVPYLLIN